MKYNSFSLIEAIINEIFNKSCLKREIKIGKGLQNNTIMVTVGEFHPYKGRNPGRNAPKMRSSKKTSRESGTIHPSPTKSQR